MRAICGSTLVSARMSFTAVVAGSALAPNRPTMAGRVAPLISAKRSI
jgi:hypothetical protein